MSTSWLCGLGGWVGLEGLKILQFQFLLYPWPYVASHHSPSVLWPQPPGTSPRSPIPPPPSAPPHPSIPPSLSLLHPCSSRPHYLPLSPHSPDHTHPLQHLHKAEGLLDHPELTPGHQLRRETVGRGGVVGDGEGGGGQGHQAMTPGDKACDLWEGVTFGEAVKRRK